MERASMPEEFKIDERGRVVGYNQMFGYVPIQPQEALEALKYKAEHKKIVDEAVSEAVGEVIRSISDQLYTDYCVMKKKEKDSYSLEIEELSEYNIDTILKRALKDKSGEKVARAKAGSDFSFIIDTLSNAQATDIKLDTIDTTKSYILTVTFNSFKDVEQAQASLKILSDTFKALYPNFTILIQVKAQGITYTISEADK